MTDKKPTVKLWSVKQGELVDFIATIENSDIVLQNGDEFIKFPGGLSPEEFKKLVDQHNEDNKGLVAISPKDIAAQEKLDDANTALLDSLK